jgi:hypothetical protein
VYISFEIINALTFMSVVVRVPVLSKHANEVNAISERWQELICRYFILNFPEGLSKLEEAFSAGL